MSSRDLLKFFKKVVVPAVAKYVKSVVKIITTLFFHTASKSSTKPKAAPSKPVAVPQKRTPRSVFIDHVEWESKDRLKVYPTPVARAIAPQHLMPLYGVNRELAWEEVVQMAPEANKNNLRD
jgi:hypothetical protein